MKELFKQTFTYKVPSEEDAVTLIEEEKANSKGLVTYKTDFKSKKEKGEIVETWYIVTITHDYTK